MVTSKELESYVKSKLLGTSCRVEFLYLQNSVMLTLIRGYNGTAIRTHIERKLCTITYMLLDSDISLMLSRIQGYKEQQGHIRYIGRS